MTMEESWSDHQIAAVYGVQGTLRATAELLGMSPEGVRQSLKRSGIETANPDGRGKKFHGLEPKTFTCEQCGGPRSKPKARCCPPCALRKSGKMRQRISDEQLVEAIRRTRDIKVVAREYAMTTLGVRSRLGTIFYHRLIGVSDDA